MRLPTLTSLLSLLAAPAANQQDASGSASWGEWRGPNRNGLSLEENWASEGRSESLWETEVGLGYSGFTIVERRLYTMGFDVEARVEVVWCLDALNGEILWAHSYETDATRFSADEGHQGGSNATPTVDADSVYTVNLLGAPGSSSGTPTIRSVSWKANLASLAAMNAVRGKTGLRIEQELPQHERFAPAYRRSSSAG